MITPALFARYPTLRAFADAEVEDVVELIRSCGYYHAKARDIVACANALINDYGGRVPDTIEELVKLPGVGRKTANLIVGDIYGKPAVVADTHCIRISNRLGLCDSKVPEKVERRLRELLPPEKSSDFCHRLVMFGRDVCDAKKPRCAGCALWDLCPNGGYIVV
jgi:endonuclease-3